MTGKLSCAEAKQIDLVDFLTSLGHYPDKITREDYWYLSPLRTEKTASFKVNRTKNVWFDFGEGKGGDLIDFGVQYFRCNVNELLEQLSQRTMPLHFSFHPQRFNAGKEKDHDGSKILILEERPLTAPLLLQYIEKRCIPLEIAQQYCREIDFELYGKKYTAIGFPNDKGGFELRNASFKGSSSPKSITFYDQEACEVTVFEGFFDFLSFQALYKNNFPGKINFLVLNSLAFFYQAKNLMDKHQKVNLYLDRNQRGMECTQEALRWDERKYKDLSRTFRQGQDMNDWLIERHSRLTPRRITENFRQRQGKGRRI